MKTVLTYVVVILIGYALGFRAGIRWKERHAPAVPEVRECVHGWGKWDYLGVNDFGLMLQSRTCTNCGWVERKMH